MTRRTFYINVILLALLVAAGWELRRRWLEAEARRAELLQKPVLPASGAKPSGPAAPPAAISPAQYFEVAERFLFSADRNPVVTVEAPPPPPPPPPRPPLPNVYGVMNLGLGPTVFMSIGSEAQKSYKVGETIGEFTLTAASPKEITFTWKEETITKPLDELVALARAATPAASNQAAPPVQPAAPRQPDFTPAPPPKVPTNVRPEPGADIGSDRRGCVPGDNSPSGTVVDGWRKTSTNYAFGPICYWERVR
jgi:hypothetical protein